MFFGGASLHPINASVVFVAPFPKIPAPRFISEAELIVNKLRSLNTNDLAKLMSIYAKKARGLMSQYIIKNKIDKVEELKLFDQAGYFYNDNLSNTKELIFTRG